MNKKYTLIPEEGTTLQRLKALRDFGDVKAGDLGGLIEKESNLSHEGECWVYGDAEVSGNAEVYGDARVSGNAEVYGNAEVSGNAWVLDDAWVFGNTRVYDDNAKVPGNTRVSNTHDGDDSNTTTTTTDECMCSSFELATTGHSKTCGWMASKK